MIKKIGVMALTVNEEIFRSHYLATYENFFQANMTDLEVVVEGLVYTQGFDISEKEEYTGLHVVRDDSVFKKGYSISEIRDYFTEKAFEDYGYDYILFCDDDFKFGSRSGECILRDFQFMESNPDVGITNFHYNIRLDEETYSKEYYDFNPSRVCTRSGIFVKRDAFVTWGGGDMVIYYEECVLAGEAYRRGYRVVHSIADIIHITKKSGLGKSLEREYKDNFSDMVGGRQVMCRKGLYVPATDKDGTVNYRKPCKVSQVLADLHHNNNNLIRRGLNPVG